MLNRTTNERSTGAKFLLIGHVDNEGAQEIRVLGAQRVGRRFASGHGDLLGAVSPRAWLLGGIYEYTVHCNHHHKLDSRV